MYLGVATPSRAKDGLVETYQYQRVNQNDLSLWRTFDVFLFEVSGAAYKGRLLPKSKILELCPKNPTI